MEEREHLERVMAAMEAQRSMLGDVVVDAAVEAIREKLSALENSGGSVLRNEPGDCESGRILHGSPQTTLAPDGEAPVFLSSSRMVDRGGELHHVQTAFQAAISSQTLHSMTVIGEIGVGKTRLLDEFIRRQEEARQSFILLRGQGKLISNDFPYALLRELIFSNLDILECDAADVAWQKLISRIGAWIGSDVLETAHWIGHLVGCDFGHDPYLNGRLDDPRRARSCAFQALNRLLTAMIQESPLVILVDDLQWVDEGSLDWLDFLAHSELGGPALLVGLTRPTLFENHPGWGERWPRHTRLELNCLSPDAAGSLVRQLLQVSCSPVPPAEEGSFSRLRADIARRSGGNPLFAEELVRAYLETHHPADEAMQSGGSWPMNVAQAVQGQLDRLPAAEREVIVRAAVIGPVFWESALHSLLDAAIQAGGTEDELLRLIDLPGTLQNLQLRGLILKRSTSAFENSAEYVFKHSVFYENLCANLHLPGRRQDHARMAAWYAMQRFERVEFHAATIAGHYECADEPLLAANWYGLAALQARRSSAPEMAEAYFNRALELLPDQPATFEQRVQFYKSLWDVQWWQARYADALASGQALLAEAESHNDQSAQAAAWNRIAAVQNRQGDFPLALRSVHRAERLARAGAAAREVVLALFNRGLTLYRLGDAAAALQAGEQALAFNQSLISQPEQVRANHFQGFAAPAFGAEGQSPEYVRPEVAAARLESSRETARILNLLALINQRAGRYAQAERDYRQVLTLHRDRGDPSAMVIALNNLGVNAHVQGDFQMAAGYFQEALALTRELSFHELELICLNHLAGAQVELGEFGPAEIGLREVLRRVVGEDLPLLTEVYRYLALACLGQGRCEEALSAGLNALTLARRTHSNEHTGRAWRVLGRVSARFGQPVVVDDQPCDAHACYANSLQIFVEMGAAGEQARTAREWAGYELEFGDGREGIRLWHEARDLFGRLGLDVEVERMDQLAAARSDPI